MQQMKNCWTRHFFDTARILSKDSKEVIFRTFFYDVGFMTALHQIARLDCNERNLRRIAAEIKLDYIG
jgi:hypothetical protein